MNLVARSLTWQRYSFQGRSIVRPCSSHLRMMALIELKRILYSSNNLHRRRWPSIIIVIYWHSTRPNMPFQSDAPASNRKKSRGRIWLTKWDKVKAHDTLIDWFTGREWPLNCMTVISAWWRSNMPFKRLSGRLSGRLNYYITRWGQEDS